MAKTEKLKEVAGINLNELLGDIEQAEEVHKTLGVHFLSLMATIKNPIILFGKPANIIRNRIDENKKRIDSVLKNIAKVLAADTGGAETEVPLTQFENKKEPLEKSGQLSTEQIGTLSKYTEAVAECYKKLMDAEGVSKKG